MKTCTKCNKSKHLDDFAKNKTGKDGLRSQCKDCHNSYYRQYFSNKANMAKQIARVYKDKKQYRWKFGEFKTKLGCAVCGYNKCDRSLHFHHKDPSKKQLLLSRARSMSLSKSKLEKEIKKCILLCANCHGEVEEGILDVSSIPTILSI